MIHTTQANAPDEIETDLVEVILAAYHGHAVAALREVMADASFLHEQLRTASSFSAMERRGDDGRNSPESERSTQVMVQMEDINDVLTREPEGPASTVEPVRRPWAECQMLVGLHLVWSMPDNDTD
ncbi:MAG: hypothetical protein EOP14_06440 [Pseudomonas sp.]|nr:MAG: hypothetical protein EOP14_06440 [Pseudomonas sp.]